MINVEAITPDGPLGVPIRRLIKLQAYDLQHELLLALQRLTGSRLDGLQQARHNGGCDGGPRDEEEQPRPTRQLLGHDSEGESSQDIERQGAALKAAGQAGMAGQGAGDAEPYENTGLGALVLDFVKRCKDVEFAKREGGQGDASAEATALRLDAVKIA